MIKKYILKSLNNYTSKWVVLAIDLVLVCFSFVFAYYIRFNTSFEFNYTTLLLQLPVVFTIALISFLIVGSYKGIIRHTGTRDAFNVFLATLLIAFLMVSIVLVNRALNIHRALDISLAGIIILYLVSTFVLIISRFVFKVFYDIISTELKAVKTILIYGAGDSGILSYGALNRDKKSNYDFFGFIDDDKNKIGKKIHQIKIYSPSIITKEFISENSIDEIIISIQNIQPNRLLEITDYLLQFDVKVKIVPPLSKWIDGDLEVNQIKNVNIEDLLNREQISIDNPIVQREVNEKVILITGAAGSIGSEISRQLSLYNCEHLILVDQAESAIYNLEQELIQKNYLNFTAIVADIRDEKTLNKIFSTYKPHKVFHAAAYKHVPLMEKNPYEAVRINIEGTKNIANLAIEYSVERFVMISTDKAVNPTNVMGATKRIAELYISCLSSLQTNTKFTTTRFGNVLGSNGSVIPLFKNQIEKGGPLTVTHPKVTRYFMTIPEACSLVLEAGTMGDGGEIYIFDMGVSVNIFDIAKRMIHLSGLKYPDDIDIEITGLRPGEKLYEELLADGENTIETYHKKIKIATTQEHDVKTKKTMIETLCSTYTTLKNDEIVSLMKEIVPEYKSNNSEYEKLD